MNIKSKTAPKKRTPGRPKLSKEQADEIREKVAQIARSLFIEEGYEKVTIRQIAAQVPCSVGVLYKYFENKRDILLYIWDDIFSTSFDHCQAASNRQKNAIDKIHHFCSSYVEYWAKNPDEFKIILLLDRQKKEDFNYTTKSSKYHKYDKIIDLIEDAINEGGLATGNGITAHEVGESLYSLSNGLSYRIVFYEGKKTKKDNITDIAINALLKHFFVDH